MSTTAPQAAPPPLPFRHRWYQFTLREMLLAALAFCLLVALIVGQRHSGTTAFFRSFDAHKAVAAACSRLGLKVDELIACQTSHSEGDRTADRSIILWLDIPPASEAEKVIAEFRREVGHQLEKCGCEIHRRGWEDEPGAKEMADFDFKYSQGGTEGDAHVCSLLFREDYYSAEGEHTRKFYRRWRMLILIHESVKYGPIGR